jgi:hypothetical protein
MGCRNESSQSQPASRENDGICQQLPINPYLELEKKLSEMTLQNYEDRRNHSGDTY